MNIPNLVSAVSDNNVHQEGEAWVCVVNAERQGVVKYDKVTAIEIKNKDLVVTGLQGNVIAQYPAADVWGAWLGWVYKEFRYSNHYNRMGPKYFLDFTWNYWEWTAPNGAHFIKHLSVPVKNSIWCDDSNTDSEILYTASYEHNYLNTMHTNGWLRAERIAEQHRIESFHYPNMP